MKNLDARDREVNRTIVLGSGSRMTKRIIEVVRMSKSGVRPAILRFFSSRCKHHHSSGESNWIQLSASYARSLHAKCVDCSCPRQ
jgi:hypothetical protein